MKTGRWSNGRLYGRLVLEKFGAGVQAQVHGSSGGNFGIVSTLLQGIFENKLTDS